MTFLRTAWRFIGHALLLVAMILATLAGLTAIGIARAFDI